MQWSLRKKVIGGYGLMLVLTIAVGVAGLLSVRRLAAELAEASDVLAPTLSDAGGIVRSAAAAEDALDSVVSAARGGSQDIPNTTRVLAARSPRSPLVSRVTSAAACWALT